jgi:hypothetical protein
MEGGMIDHFEVTTAMWEHLKEIPASDPIDFRTPFAPGLMGNYQGDESVRNDEMDVQWRAIDRQGNILAQGSPVEATHG